VSLTKYCVHVYHSHQVTAQESSSEVGKSDRHRIRLDKRKVAADTLANAREELFAGEYDA
jgi:tRNA (adenine-N(1)-)-methyltransferase non-catalytic subunit